MADATTAIMVTLDPQHEGGYQNLHDDRANWSGGEIGVGALIGTNGGITALDMPGITADEMKNLTVAQKVAFYREKYWKPLYGEIVDQNVASKLFDAGVLFGIGEAVSALQRAVSTYVDGIFGVHTLLQMNEEEPTQLLVSFKAQLAHHAQAIAAARPAEAQFLPVWLRRIAS